MNKLRFYEIDAAYVDYLKMTDGKVPKPDYSPAGSHDKFLCGIVLNVNGHDYFALMSSFKTPQRSNIIIKNEEGHPLSSIRFSFMIPVPPGIARVKDIAGEPSVKYRRLLLLEYAYCNKYASAIYSRANYVYNAVVSGKDPLMLKNCCDFKALEIACDKYVATNRARGAQDNAERSKSAEKTDKSDVESVQFNKRYEVYKTLESDPDFMKKVRYIESAEYDYAMAMRAAEKRGEARGRAEAEAEGRAEVREQYLRSAAAVYNNTANWPVVLTSFPDLTDDEQARVRSMAQNARGQGGAQPPRRG
ncbi:MAG: type III toxin-antitoxin system ToxN/AbiQ family toxin [Oscillospiraceae bacterium]|jgi:protein AbiQ|nr:type III toxin-antitoxin system ToxN/AbiQ family toxin [Oscillospiraceae bacterium]